MAVLAAGCLASSSSQRFKLKKRASGSCVLATQSRHLDRARLLSDRREERELGQLAGCVPHLHWRSMSFAAV